MSKQRLNSFFISKISLIIHQNICAYENLFLSLQTETRTFGLSNNQNNNQTNMEISSQFPFGKITTTVEDSIVEAITKEVTKTVISNITALLSSAVSEDSIRAITSKIVRQRMTGKSSVSVSPDAKPTTVTSAPVDSTTTSSSSDEFPFNLEKVVGYIIDSINLVKSGEYCSEVSDILRSDVLKETSDMVNLSLRETKYGIRIYMHDTPQVVAIHPARWSGLVKPEKVEAELLAAFSGK